MSDSLCPLKFMNAVKSALCVPNYDDCTCEYDNCAWWICENDLCALVNLALTLEFINEANPTQKDKP